MADAPPPLPEPEDPPEVHEPALTKAPPAGKLFPCVQCGARVEFDPKSRALKCPYCGHEQVIPDADADDEVLERDFKEYVRKFAKGTGTVATEAMDQVRCTGCGAVVIVEKKVVTDECPFCGTHIENKPEHVEDLIAPESVIPFAVDQRGARVAFVAWLGGLWFAPSKLRKLALLGKLTAIYMPYWTYDAMTYTRYTGMRGDNYTVTETYTDRDAQGNTVTKTRTVTKIRWRSVSGEVQHFFDDVLVCGSKSVPVWIARRLEPWPLPELEPFKPEFLAGLKTERYAVDLEEGFDTAKELMQPTIDSNIRWDIGGDHQRITSKRTRYLGVTFKHCLLPVWVTNYRYQEHLYQILINGRTGKVAGERPWSWWKICLLASFIIVMVGVIVWLIWFYKQ